MAVDNGAGDNDLKRLQRKFNATKASYVNVDLKERFMQSERYGDAADAPQCCVTALAPAHLATTMSTRASALLVPRLARWHIGCLHIGEHPQRPGGAAAAGCRFAAGIEGPEHTGASIGRRIDGARARPAQAGGGGATVRTQPHHWEPQQRASCVAQHGSCRKQRMLLNPHCAGQVNPAGHISTDCHHAPAV